MDSASSPSQRKGTKIEVLYAVNEIPPWYLTIILGFQHFLTAFATTFAFAFIISDAICVTNDGVGLGEIVSTVIFVSGLSTLIQSTIGVRLPIIQSVSAAFIVPITVVLTLDKENCPYSYPDTYNASTLPAFGSEGHKAIWHNNLAMVIDLCR